MNVSQKKRILIIGAAGMLGHKLYQMYQERFEVWATLRSAFNNYVKYEIYNPNHMLENIDVSNLDKIAQLLLFCHPGYIRPISLFGREMNCLSYF